MGMIAGEPLSRLPAPPQPAVAAQVLLRHRLLGERRLRFLATVIWLVALAIIAADLLVWAGRGFPRAPVSFARGPLGTAAIALTGVTYSTVAVFLATRLPRNPIGWIFLSIGLSMAVLLPVNLGLSDALRSFRAVPTDGLLVAWAITSIQLPAAGSLIVVVLLLFPSGRPTWRHFRVTAGLAALGGSLMSLGSMLEPTGLLWYPSLPNPVGIPGLAEEWLLGARILGMLCLVVSLVLAAVWLFFRYRAGNRHQRRQLGWVLPGAIAMVGTLSPLFAVRYATGAPDALGEQILFGAAIGGALFPIAVTVACLREHLFGIEGIVTRTLIYVPMMAILGGLYTASVMVLQKLFVAFTGNPSDAAVVMATLLLASALTPVRKSLEGLVERSTRGRMALGRDASGIPAPAAAGLPAQPEPDAVAAILARLDALEGQLAAVVIAGTAVATDPVAAIILPAAEAPCEAAPEGGVDPGAGELPEVAVLPVPALPAQAGPSVGQLDPDRAG